MTMRSSPWETFTFLRHAEPQDGDDSPLTERGRGQAHDMAMHLESSRSAVDLIMTSTARRATETARIISDRLGNKAELVELPALHLPSDVESKKQVLELLNRLANQPLQDYLQEDTSGAWQRYTNEAFTAIENCLHNSRAQNILVVAHGNIINSLGLVLLPEGQQLLNIYFGHCEGFKLSFNAGNIVYLTQE